MENWINLGTVGFIPFALAHCFFVLKAPKNLQPAGYWSIVVMMGLTVLLIAGYGAEHQAIAMIAMIITLTIYGGFERAARKRWKGEIG